MDNRPVSLRAPFSALGTLFDMPLAVIVRLDFERTRAGDGVHYPDFCNHGITAAALMPMAPDKIPKLGGSFARIFDFTKPYCDWSERIIARQILLSRIADCRRGEQQEREEKE
jgi:hypothetical protein